MALKRSAICLLSFLFLLFPQVALATGKVELVADYSIDEPVFTQGLELLDKQLVLGTGLYGESEIGYLDLTSGKFQTIDTLEPQYFGEGLTATPHYLWQYTWREGKAFKRSLDDLSIQETVDFDGSGWGMAYDEEEQVIWTSDGTEKLTKRNPETFEAIDFLTITYQGKPITQINELEFANGSIYANVWQTNFIVKINLTTGKVDEIWDLTPLVEQLDFKEENPDRVLNGIAHIEDNRFLVTGKLFPIVWEVHLK